MLRRLCLSAIAIALPAVGFAESAMDHKDGTQFTVRIENVSTPMTLKSMKGETAPAPNSPGLWVVHTKPARLFKADRAQMGWGLEAQAEDGNPSMLAEHCKSHEGVRSSGVFNTPVGDDMPGPALPGKTYLFTVTAKPGDRLSFVTMFGQSNDLFYAPAEAGIALFEKGHPVSGDITSRVLLWDAGTEINEEPGFGPNQAPRQAAPNTGPSELKPVTLVSKLKDGLTYPKVTDVLKITITPAQTAGRY